jgi:hypothetical protein
MTDAENMPTQFWEVFETLFVFGRTMAFAVLLTFEPDAAFFSL